MEQRERDESSSKLEEALRELTGAETTGKIEEYENEREGADVDSETACTDMRRAERMPAWRQEEDARKSKLSESRADVIKELNDDDWEQEELDELDEWDESEKSPRGMGRLAAVFRPSDDLLAAFFLPVVILILIFAYRGIFPFGQESFLRTDMYHQYAPFFSEFREKRRILVVHIRPQEAFLPKGENTAVCKNQDQNHHRQEKCRQEIIRRTENRSQAAHSAG